MKKISVLFVGIIGMIFTSCGFKSEEKPLTETLVTYTAEGNKKGEAFLGVKEKGKDGQIVVKAGNYTDITTDDFIITCSYSDGDCDVYTLTGRPIALKSYRSFKQHETNGYIYYIGQSLAPETSVVYFPGQEPMICKHCAFHQGPKHLYVAAGMFCDVFTYDSKRVWSFPAGVVINSISTKEDFVIVPSEVTFKGVAARSRISVTMATIYTPDGKEIKNLNTYQWKKLQKKLNLIKPQEIGTVKLYTFETFDVKKL